jgi:hypothetical protein
MGLFKNFTKILKKAAPVIGGAVGFGLGGPMGAAIGSGIGGLAAGQDVEDALKTAAIGGALGYGASKMFPGSAGFLKPGTVTNPAVAASTSAVPAGGIPAAAVSPAVTAADVAAAQKSAAGSGVFGNLFTDMSTGQKIALGLGSLGALGALTQEEEEIGSQRPFPKGEMFDITARSRDGDVYQLNDPEDLAAYQREISNFNYMDGGEVTGPGTGTSDSVPARLSDGEFVVTAKAVRGAGGGDRDIGAARMYDMMAELEASA